MLQYLLNKLKYNKYHLFAFGFIAVIAHPVHWFWWVYVIPNPYENATLRIIGGLSCLVLLFMTYREDLFKKILPFYWLFIVIYNLPFFFTVNLIKNNLIDIWLMEEIVMIFTVILFIPNIFAAISAIIVGVFGAVIFSAITDQMNIYPADLLLSHSIVYMLAMVAAYIFNRSNVMGIKAQEKQKYLEEKVQLLSLTGSIAHELRNPLNTINLIGSQIKDLAPQFDRTNVENSSDAKSKLLNLTSHITDATYNANNIINIILADLSEKKIDRADFAYLRPSKVLPEILEKYGYKSEEERKKIKLLLPTNEQDNFLFKAIPDRFAYIIFNLLKNALYYLDQYPESTIAIGTDTKGINGISYNAIYIHDTGPGIAPHIIPKLFGDFYTSGKKEGTGLGLAFCKRNMKLFDGDIICESEFGHGKNGWTRFSLLFPILSEPEIEAAKIESRRRKILLVDDQEVNLIMLKSKIERILPDISCDIAQGGKEAISMAKENKYHLILMDIQMPKIDGIEAAKKIRTYDKEVPIIALTSLNKELFLEEIEVAKSKKDFSYYLSKLSATNLLYRTVSKWITGLEDEMSYVGAKEEYLEALKSKKVILADDERLNRIMTRRVLETAGIIVTEANNGEELLQLYKNSLDANGKSSFDIIITDINMPPYNGDDVTKEIRNIESTYKISHHDEMPIIAFSGDGKKEDIHHFFECQMTDYFIKGSKPELLLKIIANYLIKK
ncbi:MAG: integral rane sensor hybrid histidine kinase [Rickettsiaceae bacterium]|jgi:CheY-like chemotaxis protein|nr:integral rane sensor hybrid histidine kinase [Rickettsiaceae bacterium]